MDAAQHSTDTLAGSKSHSHQHRAGQIAGSTKQRGVREMLEVDGRIDTPKITANLNAVLGRVKDGSLSLDIPLRQGVNLPDVSIRPGTHARLQLTLKDGRVDLNATGDKAATVTFVDADGEDTDLDGPAWWNPDRVYVEDGRIFADVPCWPDPDITSQVLQGPDRIPDSATSPAKLLELFTSMGADETPLVPAAHFPEVDSAKSEDSRDADRAALPSPKNSVDDSLLTRLLDRDNLVISFAGTMREGPLNFGPNAKLTLPKDAAVTVSGPLDELTVSADIQGLELIGTPPNMAPGKHGTIIKGGPGHVQLTVRQGDKAGPPGVETAVSIDALELETLSLSTPGRELDHRISARDVRLYHAPGTPALIATTRSSEGTSDVNIHLQDIELSDVRAQLEVIDTDDRHLYANVGRTSDSHEIDPLNLVTSIMVDSKTRRFEFHGDSDNVRAELSDFGLAHSSTVDVDVAMAVFSGAGTVHAIDSPDELSVSFQAREGTSWSVGVSLADTLLGDPNSTGIVADVAEDTDGVLNVHTLDFSSNHAPEFRADGSFQVTLDALRVPLVSGDSISLRSGTKGVLTIDNMSYEGGNPSAEVRASLAIELGADIALTPKQVRGLEDAAVRIEIDTGNTTAIFDVVVNKDGSLGAAAGINLRRVGLATSVARAVTPEMNSAPTIALPEEPLPPLGPFPLKSARRLQRSESKVGHTDGAEIKPPKLPTISLQTEDVLPHVSGLSGSFDIPTDAIAPTIVAEIDQTETVSRSFLGVKHRDRQGHELTISVSKPAGSIRGAIAANSTTISADGTHLILDPPVEIHVEGVWHLPVLSQSIEWSLNPTVRSLRIERDHGTGQARLVPDIEHLAMGIPNIAQHILEASEAPYSLTTLTREARAVLETVDIEGRVGAELTTKIFGSARFPLDRDVLMKLMQARAKKNATSKDPSPLLKALHLDQAKVRIDHAEIVVHDNPVRLDLGEGQHITLQPGTRLSIAGTNDDMRISGLANLGEINLGNEAVGVSAAKAMAEISLRIQGGLDNTEHRMVSLEVNRLRSDELLVAGTIGRAGASATVASVKNGSVRIETGGGAPSKIIVDLPNTISAKLRASGAVEVNGYTGQASNFEGDVTGTLHLEDGKISGVFDHIGLRAPGLAFGNGTLIGAAHGLTIEGAARLETAKNGDIRIYRSGAEGLSLKTSVATNTGASISIKESTISGIVIAGDGSGLTVLGADAAISGVIPIAGVPLKPGQDPTEACRAVIRHAQIHGDLHIGPDGLTTPGEVEFSEFDGSLANINNIRSKQTELDLRQLDITGSGSLSISEKGWDIHGRIQREAEPVEDSSPVELDEETQKLSVIHNGRILPVTPANVMKSDLSDGYYQLPTGDLFRVRERSSLRSRGLVDEMKFTTASPDLQMDMASLAQLQADVLGFFIGPGERLHIDAINGQLDGMLDGGLLTVGPEGSAVEKVTVESGGLVRAFIDKFMLNIGDDVYPELPRFALNGTLRVQGHIKDKPERMPEPLSFPNSTLQLIDAEFGVDFSMLMGVSYSDGGLMANTYTRLDNHTDDEPAAKFSLQGHVNMRDMAPVDEVKQRLRESAQQAAHDNSPANDPSGAK